MKFIISNHFGLDVNVRNKSRLPAHLQMAIASWKFWDMYQGPPMKLEDSTMCFLTNVSVVSPCKTAFFNPLYSSDRSWGWFAHTHRSLYSSMHVYDQPGTAETVSHSVELFVFQLSFIATYTHNILSWLHSFFGFASYLH